MTLAPGGRSPGGVIRTRRRTPSRSMGSGVDRSGRDARHPSSRSPRRFSSRVPPTPQRSRPRTRGRPVARARHRRGRARCAIDRRSPIGAVGGLVTVNYSLGLTGDSAGHRVPDRRWSVESSGWRRAHRWGGWLLHRQRSLEAPLRSSCAPSVSTRPQPLTTPGHQCDPSVGSREDARATATVGPSAPHRLTPSKPVAAPPAAPVSTVQGTSNGAGTGTNGALAATTGDAGIDAPCLARTARSTRTSTRPSARN